MSNKIKLAPPPEPQPDPDDDPGTAVALAYVHQNDVSYSWHHSLTQLIAYDANSVGRIWRGGFVAMRGGTDGLAHARNTAVRDFLADRRADWLWWVDTDMGFEPDTVDRLMEAADPVERPIVGGLCFAQREAEPDGMGGWRPVAWPTVMDWTVIGERGGFEVRWDYPRGTVTRCHGTGSACILVHRSVFERMRDAALAELVAAGRQGQDWQGWYSRVMNPSTGELVSEDLSFCMRLMKLEIPVHVHTGVQTTHAKPIWLGEQDYWRQRALSAPPETTVPLPAEEREVPRCAVIPTHSRPQRLLALVSSLGPQVDTIVVLDNASAPPVDEQALRQASRGATVEVIRDPEQPPHLSRFWNVLLDRCAELAKAAGQDAWDVAVLNDDAIVPAGWFDVCSTVLRGHETAAVAHTGTTPVHRPELLTEIPYPRESRMCPWAFVVRGEQGLRADEDMRWWFFDDAFCQQAIDAGGVLAAPGPLVINANAVESTVGVLAEQAERDEKVFERKWVARETAAFRARLGLPVEAAE